MENKIATMIRTVILLCIVFKSTDGQVTAAHVGTLLTNLFNGYDTRVRPVKADQSVAVDVRIDLFLISINNFDSAEQKLETTTYLEIKWTDEVLADTARWTETNISEILVPQTDLWLPDLALQNGFESLTGLGNNFYNVRVEKAGSVTWRPYHVFDSACTVDITYFPFDKTTCELKFVIWSNPKTLIMVKQGTNGLNMNYYGENSEWSILKTVASDFVTSTSSGVTFSIEMKRKPLFYLLNILLPVIMLAVLNSFVFALPASSGERTGFAVTCFLAFAVFLTIISAELPQNSESISTFSAYLFLMTFISTLITLITIVELRIFNREPEVPIPNGLHSITRCVRRLQCRDCCSPDTGYIRGFKMAEVKRKLTDDVTWEDAVDALDFVLFWVFFLMIVVITVACCVIAAMAAFE